MENSPESQNRPKPFSKERTKFLVGRIIFFYSLFYILAQIFRIFSEELTKSYLLLNLPFLALASWGYWQERKKAYSWIYIIIGIVLISLIRYYSEELLLQQAV